MVRNYKKKTQRCSYAAAKLQEAISEINSGKSVKSISKNFGVAPKTLRRHRYRTVKNPGTPGQGRQQYIPIEIEECIADHIREMNTRMFGLTTQNVKKLVYDTAVARGIDHPFNDNKKMAGKDWLSSFMKRHALTVRLPQATSILRMVGFNKPKVQEFYNVYQQLLSDRGYKPTSIFNMDETGITTVQKSGKVVAQKGIKNVSRATSAERGQLVTVICTMSASGYYVPPLFISPP